MPAQPPRPSRQSGFTLIELTIALVVIVELLLAIFTLFDFSYRVSHIQTNLADMQQSLRVAQTDVEPMVRMAGRGGLPFSVTAPGGAVAVRDNVGANTNIAVGDATSPLVVQSTDVLTVRGEFSAPVYQTLGTAAVVYRNAAGNVTTDPTQAVTGVLTISSTSPAGVAQNLKALSDAVSNNVPEALLMVSSRDASTYAVVQLNPGASNVTATQATLAFQVTGGTNSAAYATLFPGGPTLPAGLTRINYAGILEEYRFYIRNAATTGPKLSRARFFPGTQTAWGPTGANNSANLQVDVADDILDLQVALGLDTSNHVARATPPDPPGLVLTTIAADPVNCYISEAANGQNDDWLYNDTTDNAAAAVWTNAPLYYVRLSLLARTDRRDPSYYQAPTVNRIEDHVYATSDPLNVNTVAERRYRRRLLQTTIDVRNAS